MKKNILLTAMATTIIVACTILISDGLTYLTTALMALCIIAVVQANKSRMMKMTRWAKAKPGKAQGLITVIQFALFGLGILAGKNLRELGYEFTDTTAYVFTAILVIGFLSVPFRPKRDTIAIPEKLDRQRLGYLSIILSSLILTAFIGNRIEDVYPDSPVTHVINSVDQWIFTDNLAEQTDPVDREIGHIQGTTYGQDATDEFSGKALFVVNPVSDTDKMPTGAALKKLKKAEKKAARKAKKKERKLRRAASGGICAAAVLLIILLLAPLCAGICLIIGAWGSTGAGAVLGGVLLTGASIWGMIKLGQWCKNS
jgi:Na+-translocating ferredoxin:NAD+ oxidoreductase RnfA subunit